MRKFTLIALSVVLFTAACPLFLYWWGLSNLEEKPIPSQVMLTAEAERRIWYKEYGTDQPILKGVSSYGYIVYFFCSAKNVPRALECEAKYPGLRLSSLAVRMQVAKQVKGKGNAAWQFTWIASALWVTRNWDIHQVIATYDEQRST